MLRYPDLLEPYATALREAVDFVFARFSPCAVVAAGTIVRGTPSASSDLDIYVLHHAPERQRIQRRFGGVPAEIFVNPPEQVERYFEQDEREGRPITAHMLSTGFVVYASDDSLERLRHLSAASIARGPAATEQDLIRQRYMAATGFEDAEDVAEVDPHTATALLTRAVEDAVRYRFVSARIWRPRPKDTLRRLGEVDPAAAIHALAFYRATSLDERFVAARALYECLGVPTGFFEWESEPEALP